MRLSSKHVVVLVFTSTMILTAALVQVPVSRSTQAVLIGAISLIPTWYVGVRAPLPRIALHLLALIGACFFVLNRSWAAVVAVILFQLVMGLGIAAPPVECGGAKEE
ncbi:MAG: hypothetical protein ABL949_07105 [Fimbriimonadaceae bacterium]